MDGVQYPSWYYHIMNKTELAEGLGHCVILNIESDLVRTTIITLCYCIAHNVKHKETHMGRNQLQ